MKEQSSHPVPRLLLSNVINVCVVTLDMGVMFCTRQADKGDLLKQKLAPAPVQWVFYGFVVNKNWPFIFQRLQAGWSSIGRSSLELNISSDTDNRPVKALLLTLNLKLTEISQSNLTQNIHELFITKKVLMYLRGDYKTRLRQLHCGKSCYAG